MALPIMNSPLIELAAQAMAVYEQLTNTPTRKKRPMFSDEVSMRSAKTQMMIVAIG